MGWVLCVIQVRLRVPEISVAMDAKEFQILQDVGSHLAGEQVRCHTSLAYTPSLGVKVLRIMGLRYAHYRVP